MFDVKTPLRTYYLAANSEEDMNAWVNCICEVCNLQDLSKPQQPVTGDNRQCMFLPKFFNNFSLFHVTLDFDKCEFSSKK